MTHSLCSQDIFKRKDSMQKQYIPHCNFQHSSMINAALKKYNKPARGKSVLETSITYSILKTKCNLTNPLHIKNSLRYEMWQCPVLNKMH